MDRSLSVPKERNGNRVEILERNPCKLDKVKPLRHLKASIESVLAQNSIPDPYTSHNSYPICSSAWFPMNGYIGKGKNQTENNEKM